MKFYNTIAAVMLLFIFAPNLNAQTDGQKEVLGVLAKHDAEFDRHVTRLFKIDRDRELVLRNMGAELGLDVDSLLSLRLTDMLADSIVMGFPAGYLTDAQENALGMNPAATGPQRMTVTLGQAANGTWQITSPPTANQPNGISWRIMARSGQSFVLLNFNGKHVTFLFDPGVQYFQSDKVFRDVTDAVNWEKNPLFLSYDTTTSGAE